MRVCGGVNLHVETIVARSDAPWLLFSNSILTDLTIWDRQIPVLKESWNILRYDQRGHGRSDVVQGPLDFHTLGQDVIELLDAAGIERATYVGLSMGVPTGLAAHAISPRRFDRLVFVDGQAASAPSGAAFWDDRIALARKEGMDALADATTKRWLKCVGEDDERAKALSRMIAATSPEGFASAASALRQYDYTHVLDGLSIPLRMIAGAEDGAIPEAMARIQARVGGSTLVTIPGCGHIPNFEAPDEFNAALLAVLA